MFLWYNSKIVLKIPLNLVAAAVVNAKQCVLKLFTSPGVCTLPFNVTRNRIVTKYCNFACFQQKPVQGPR